MGTVRPAYRATLESGQSYASRERAARWCPAVGGARPAEARRWRGLIPGPIWPCLASFTPGREAENEAGAASFGPPLTRTRLASRPRLWPCLASSGVAKSGETFNSVPFGSISFHRLSSTRVMRAGNAMFQPSRKRRLVSRKRRMQPMYGLAGQGSNGHLSCPGRGAPFHVQLQTGQQGLVP